VLYPFYWIAWILWRRHALFNNLFEMAALSLSHVHQSSGSRRPSQRRRIFHHALRQMECYV